MKQLFVLNLKKLIRVRSHYLLKWETTGKSQDYGLDWEVKKISQKKGKTNQLCTVAKATTQKCP